MFIKTDLALNSTWQMFLNSADGLFINILASSSAARPTNQPGLRRSGGMQRSTSKCETSSLLKKSWQPMHYCLPPPSNDVVSGVDVGRSAVQDRDDLLLLAACLCLSSAAAVVGQRATCQDQCHGRTTKTQPPPTTTTTNLAVCCCYSSSAEVGWLA